MPRVTIVTGDKSFAGALGRALRFLCGWEAVCSHTIGEVECDRSRSMVLDIGPEQDRRGTLVGFYHLRPLLMGDKGPFRGPIALVSSERRLFSNAAQVIPPSEGVHLFTIPFSLPELLAYLTCSEEPQARRYTRMFLRGHLTHDDIRALANGDTHGLPQFDVLALSMHGRSL